MEGTAQRLIEIIGEVNPSIRLQPTDFTKAISDAGIDSLDFSYVLLRIEETMGIKITDDESASLRSLDDLRVLIDTRKGA